MALESEENTTDNIECSSDSSINNLTAFTWYIAIRTVDTAPITRWMTMVKGFTDKYFKIETTKKPHFYVERAGTDAEAIGSSNYDSSGAWQHYYFTYDETDGPRIFLGTDTVAPTEISYSSRTVGTLGTTSDSSAAFRVLNHDQVGFNRGFDGDFARCWIAASRLTLAEIQQRQTCPHKVWSDTRLIWDSEVVDSSGVLIDLSGKGNHGTPTGLTRNALYPIAAQRYLGGLSPSFFNDVAAPATAVRDVIGRGLIPYAR